uniref:Replicase n=1 Tax=Bole Tick Virus 2 TaxID=1608041 RepID=A0A8G0QWQ6_9RHAB|nr:MAG: polymerase [Bole Tick Virus 2]
MYEDDHLSEEGPPDPGGGDDLELEIPPLEDFLRERVFSGSSLNRFDYNLNSPLIPDQVEHLLSALKGRNVKNKYTKNPTFVTKVQSATLYPTDYSQTLASSGFHCWIAREVFQKRLGSRNFRRVFDLSHPDAEAAMRVGMDFWEALTGHRTVPELEGLREEIFMKDTKSEVVTRMQEDGEAFWFFYQVILLMNSATPSERRSLVATMTDLRLELKQEEDPEVFAFRGTHPDWGSFVVGPGFIHLETHGRLLDRNMTLMIKDTMVARFTGKMSQIFDAHKGRQYLLVTKLHRLYQLGDEIMAMRGNDFYDVLQYLEPHCNQRLSDLAWKYRKRIPRDRKFSDFLDQEVLKLEAIGEGPVYSFFKTISKEPDWEVVLRYYGIFRHWGHPFIDYLAGLKRLHSQVSIKKVVDHEYAEALASDLTYIVLKHEFDKQKRWFVDINQLDPKHKLYQSIKDCTWPTPGLVDDFGDKWHLLPLIPCYEVPASIDPSVLLADRSHSPDRPEVEKAIQEAPDRPIPSLKVLESALQKPQRNTREFLTSINDVGLPRRSLVIGLKGKEREIKKNGRFFALMSWDLREYFVSTEYLIKMFYVPLFQGLTMADDLNSVTKKILGCTFGQGLAGYTAVTFTNHLDYEKWNNHQRREATDPVFRVMGQFFGLPELFVRTHEFFQKSLIYYGERPDLMQVVDGKVSSIGDAMVAWEGQEGGLEGLRQKGWSVLNLLVILREALIRNTQVLTLAQGDNQVICTQYKVPDGLKDVDLDEELLHISQNNLAIMNAIHAGTSKLGLIINQKETLISSDYLTYGKVPVFRGCIQPHAIKRYSRVTCIPNDQIPSIGNSISTVGTSAITVAQFSKSILGPWICYILFGYMVLRLHMYHSPLLKGSLLPLIGANSFFFILRALFLDPVLGGISGMSGTRMLIRQFPDPVSEGLSFWKMIYQTSRDIRVQLLALSAGEPPLKPYQVEDLGKLLEKPVSLNLPKGLSAVTLVKNEVRKWLVHSKADFKNKMIAEAVSFVEQEEPEVQRFLTSIQPLFPRFLSEFAAGSFLGLTESIVGLFQNSRTIRAIFSSRFRREISDLLIKSELIATLLLSKPPRPSTNTIWFCSSERADNLRSQSWGRKVYGTTVPHPAEMFGLPTRGGADCESCREVYPVNEHVTVCFPSGLDLSCDQKGLLAPYLGSRTSESTSLFQPWEKDVKLPLIERALKLRVAIHWFVDPGTNVAKAILENLRSLTGLDWEETNVAFSRSGCVEHRYKSVRQSNGGFSAVNPTGISWVIVTADTMPMIGQGNYDFMYQATMLYSQTTSLEINQLLNEPDLRHHYHIRCTSCLREVSNIKLDSPFELRLPDVHESVFTMSGGISPQFTRTEGVAIPKGDWRRLSPIDKCFHIGVGAGANYGILQVDNDPCKGQSILFPTSLGRRLQPIPFLMGLLQGLLMAASYEVVYRRLVMWKREPSQTLLGAGYHLIECICNEDAFISMTGLESFQRVLLRSSRRVPPSYPASNRDLGQLAKSFLESHLLRKSNIKGPWAQKGETLWVFSDFRTPRMTGLMILTHRLWEILRQDKVSSAATDEIRMIKDQIAYYSSRDRLFTIPYNPAELHLPSTSANFPRVKWCESEIRHAGREGLSIVFIPPADDKTWGPEFVCTITATELDFSTLEEEKTGVLVVPRCNNPLISGLRVVQLATGAHFKLRGILAKTDVGRDGLIAGDGSGGMTAAFLRFYPQSRALFNSLLVVKDRQLKGVAPGPPSAIAAMPKSVRDRCVNADSAWKEPADLTLPETWTHFKTLQSRHQMEFSHLIFDMEVVSERDIKRIVDHLINNLHDLLIPTGFLIFKMYGSREAGTGARDLERLGRLFKKAYGVTTGLTSSQSSEFYLVGQGLYRGKITAKNLTRSSFTKLLRRLPAMQSPEKEFTRALNVSPKALMTGIPPEVLPDPKLDLISILSYLGLESGVAIKYASIVMASQQMPEVPKACLVILGLQLLSNSLVPLTKWLPGSYAPPSDQSLIGLISAFIGCWDFISWYYGSLRIHTRLAVFKAGLVHWCYREIYRSTKKGVQKGVEWDWFEPSWARKGLSKPFEPNVAGQIIRIFARIWPTREFDRYPLWQDFEVMLAAYFPLFNKGLHPLDTLFHTGLWYPGVGSRRVRVESWAAEAEEELKQMTKQGEFAVEFGWEM